MAVQGRTDFTNYSVILSGGVVTKSNETILTNAGRTTPLVRGTVMAQIAASRKWVPLTDVAALDGSNTARGIYLGEDDITAAALVAGDVTGVVIAVLGTPASLDSSLLVLENSLTINSVCSDDPAGADNGVVNTRRIEDDLARIGFIVNTTSAISKIEN